MSQESQRPVSSVVESIADQLTGRRVYLDGAPARITGRLNNCATIAPDDPAIASVEFAWTTANRIVRERGGFFES